MELIQNKFPSRKIFRLQETKVDVFDKTLTEELEYSIDYLELGNKLVRKKGMKSRIGQLFLIPYFILTFGLFIHTVITDPNSNMIPFWLLGSGFFLGISLLAHFSVKTNLVYITGGNKTLELFQNKPDTDSVNKFITELQTRIKKSYQKEFLKFGDSTPDEFRIGQIEWLNRIDMISDEETKMLMEKLENNGNTYIGFNIRNES